MKDSARKAMWAKHNVSNKDDIVYDYHDGKYKLHGIPIHKGFVSKAEKEKLKLLDSQKSQSHHLGIQTQNKIDWRNMNRELSELEEKMNNLDQKELDGKINAERYMREHDALEKQFTFIRWKKYGHLR